MIILNIAYILNILYNCTLDYLKGDVLMSEIQFDGKTAVVTGAGGGLGRKAYALLLASRRVPR